MVTYPDYWIFTVQMGMWRYPRDLRIPLIDITAKSGIQAFAPHWDDLMTYKRGGMSNQEYSHRYYDKVIPTLRTHPEEWKKIKEHKTFALACYCKPGNFCHRYLFGMLAVNYLQSLGETVEFQGELIPHPNNKHFYSREDRGTSNDRRRSSKAAHEESQRDPPGEESVYSAMSARYNGAEWSG